MLYKFVKTFLNIDNINLGYLITHLGKFSWVNFLKFYFYKDITLNRFQMFDIYLFYLLVNINWNKIINKNINSLMNAVYRFLSSRASFGTKYFWC